MTETLPGEVDQLRADARAERFRFVDRLVDEWASGANCFSETGEALLVARVDEALAGIGGLTLEPTILGALRMRRFYVRPPYRRMGIGRRIVERLLVEPSRSGTIITVNAGTDVAPAFWEALGFKRDERDGYTHCPASDEGLARFGQLTRGGRTRVSRPAGRSGLLAAS